jgi:AcrR family transcriptional regulator
VTAGRQRADAARKLRQRPAGAAKATVVPIPPLPPEPPTPKGRRTQATLIQAAREVFSRDGFVDARIADIADMAGVAHGTFYSYFDSKEQIFRAVIHQLELDLAKSRPNSNDNLPPAARIEEANRHYLRSYRDNAALFATLEQAATLNQELRLLRKEGRSLLVSRSARAIAHWQEAGLADPDLDPRYAANALGNMVDRFAYVWFVLGEDFEEETAVATLTRLWVQALGLDRTHALSAARGRAGSTRTLRQRRAR